MTQQSLQFLFIYMVWVSGVDVKIASVLRSTKQYMAIQYCMLSKTSGNRHAISGLDNYTPASPGHLTRPGKASQGQVGRDPSKRCGVDKPSGVLGADLLAFSGCFDMKRSGSYWTRMALLLLPPPLDASAPSCLH